MSFNNFYCQLFTADYTISNLSTISKFRLKTFNCRLLFYQRKIIEFYNQQRPS